MNNIAPLVSETDADRIDPALFDKIAQDLTVHGHSISPLALPEALAAALLQHQLDMDQAKYNPAGIGRGDDYLKNEFVRTDEICWINDDSAAGRDWLAWTSQLQQYLNRRLFLGLFSFESHFAHYRPGDYYKRHYDTFRGQANRVLTVVTYLNPGWTSDDGGELVLYQSDSDREGIRILPVMGTVAVFLSEEFPHEVLPASRDRYSIAGWYRVNTTVTDRVDPPR